MTDLRRWNEIKAIAQEALDRPEHERTRYLEEACGGDEELRREVAALLAVSSTRADFFDHFQVLPPGMQRSDLAEGTIVGHYRIIRPLGQGGMGSVYLAQDTEVDRKVALKILPRRLTQEQELHARLQHPNIAIFFDSGTTQDGFGYFAMEYVEGEPVTDYCERQGLPVEERLTLFLQVCDAVAFAHRNLVVHRDIKPSNILVDAEGKPKLLDFGIAKLLPSGEDLLTLTRPEERSLTLAFASPEQLEGERTTTATDIYSLGVLLCLLLTGRLPYPVKTYHDLPWAIRNMEPEKPSKLVLRETATDEQQSLPASMKGRNEKLSRTLRGDLDAIALKALRKEPERRYATVVELAEDIRRFLTDQPVSAVRGSTRYKTRKFIKRHTAGSIISVLAIVACIVLATIFITQYQEVTRQRDEARRQTQRAEAVSDFLTGIFELSDPWKNKPEVITARQLLDRAAQDIERDQRIDPLSRAGFLDTLGDSYLNLGLLDRASTVYGTSLSLRRKATGPRDPSVGKSLHNLGLVAARQGRYKNAKRLYLEALSIQRPALGPRHRDIALTLHDLGITLSNLAEYNNADAVIREALKMQYAVLGKDDSVTVNCLSELAAIQGNLGHLSQAEKLYRAAIPRAKKALGADHPVIADMFSNLALLLERQHRLDEAERLAREGLFIRRSRFGNSHPEVASSLDNLARIEYQRGKNSIALKLSKESLVIRIRFLGRSHPTVASSLTALGVLEMEAENFEEAEKYFRQALDVFTKVYGLEHPHTAMAIQNIASALRHKGNLPEAERLYRLSLSIYIKLLGVHHPQALSTKHNLAIVLGDKTQYADAEALFDDAITGMQETLGPTHPSVAWSLKQKAFLLIKQGRFSEALPLARDAFTILDKELAPQDPARESIKVVVATALVGLHRFDEAEILLLEALGRLKTSKETSQKYHKLALEGLVSLYDAWGKPQKATEYRKLLANATSTRATAPQGGSSPFR